MIIRENEPKELPPDVIRSSDKTDLGLGELHTLNVKERFQVFENRKQEEEKRLLDPQETQVKRSATVLSRLAKYVSLREPSESRFNTDVFAGLRPEAWTSAPQRPT